jgi:beta-galactosidase
VPDAKNKLTFTVTGAARLRALDNGNLTCPEPYVGTTRSSFRGRNMALVQSTRKPGPITVKVTADGLTPATVMLTSK